MNKIYKSIWNVVTQSFTAVSESQKSRGKRSKSMKLGGGIALVALLASNIAQAAWYVGGNIDVDTIIFGAQGQGRDDGRGTTIWSWGGATTLIFDTGSTDIATMGGANKFIDYSSIGLAQSLMYSDEMTIYEDAFKSLNARPSNGGQKVTQTLTDIGTVEFAIGSLAYDLATQNLENFAGIISMENGELRGQVGGTSYGYNENGIAYQSSTWDSVGHQHIWTMALLTGVHINNGKTLSLKGIGDVNIEGEEKSDNHKWSAKVTGAGSIEYIGTNKDSNILDIVTVLEKDENGETYDDSNTYEGSTNVENLTLKLRKQKALGKTSSFTASNSDIFLLGSHEVEDGQTVAHNETVGSLSFSGSTLNFDTSSHQMSVTGDATFDISSQLIGAGTLIADNTTLHGASENFSGTVVSNDTTTIYNVKALGTGKLETTDLAFKGANGEFVNTVNGDKAISEETSYHVLIGSHKVVDDQLIHSNISYASDAILNVNSTTIDAGSTLKVVDVNVEGSNTQLGSKVFFTNTNNLADYAVLTIQSTDKNPINGISLSSVDSYAIVELDGLRTDGKTTEYVLDENHDNSGYKGWIRITNANLTLQSNHSNHGFSIGTEGNVYVAGSSPVTLGMFGWSSDGSKGVLDLTQFQFTSVGTQTPALNVTTLYLDAPATIRVNSDSFLTQALPSDGSNILTWDATASGDNAYRIISASEVVNVGAHSITVFDKGTDSEKEIGGGIATAKFGALATADSYGVLISYGMNELQLKNASTPQDALDLQLNGNVDNELRALLSGSGKLSVTKALDSNVSEFKLSNESNSFTNSTVTINEGVTLVADVGALGQAGTGNNTLILNEAAYKTVKVGDSDTLEIQELASLQDSGKLSSVELADNTGLKLTGTSTWDSLVLNGSASTSLQLSENACLTVNKAEEALNGYEGELTVDGILALSYDQPQSGRAVSGISGSGTIELSKANWTLADGEFAGNYELKGSSLTVNDSTGDFNAKLIVLDDSSTLSVSDRNDFLGETAIRFIESTSDQVGTVEILRTSGKVKLASDTSINGKFMVKGSSSVSLSYDTLLATEIEAGSAFTYKISSSHSDWSLSSISGGGMLGLSFAEHLNSLNLGDYADFGGTLRFDNATLTVGENSNYKNNSLTNQDGIALYVGTNSNLVMDGQATFSKNLTFEGGAVVDFTTKPSTGFNSNGLSVNAMLFDNNSGLIVNGDEGVKLNVKFDSSNIAISEGIGEQAGDSLLDALGSTAENPAEALRLMSGITLQDTQTANSLVGSMTLVETDNLSNKVFAYMQNEEHVADIVAGVGLIATEENGKVNIGVGGTVTQLRLLTTLEIDVSDRDSVSESAEILPLITGSGNINFSSTGNDVEGKADVLLQNANSDYTGTTTVKDGVWVQANNGGALGKTSMLNIGADENDTARVTLNSSGSQLFEQTIGGVSVERSATLELSPGENRMNLSIDGNLANGATSSLKGKLIGASGASLRLDNGALLQVDQDTDLSGFDGLFYIGNGTLAYDVAEGLEGTFDSRVSGAGFVEKTGAGTLTLSNTDTAMNLRLSDGTVVLAKDVFLNTFVMGADSSRARAQSNTNVVTELEGVSQIVNFVGNGGTFVMDVSLGESEGEGATVGLGENGNDGLHILESATGHATIEIRDKNALKKGAEERVKLVEIDANADVTFALAGAAITAGGYDYLLLEKDRVATGDEVETGSDWYLSSVEGEETIRNTTVNAGSYIAIASAAQLFDLSLHDRVGNRDWINPVTGEKQSTSLWMHQTFSHERSRDSTNQIRMRNTSSVTMLGGDLVQWTTSGNGMAYAGVMGGYGTMDTKSRSHRTNLRSDANTDAWGVGAYFGWKADSDAFTGPYVDGWVMFTHADSTVEGTDVREDAKGQGLSASIEAGWGFHVGSVKTDNGKAADFHIEPHVSATWFGMNYDDISNETHDVTFEGHNNVRTRLGARVMISERETKKFNVFTEVNWVHNTQEYGATISGLRVDQAGARNQGEARLGVDWRVTDRLSVWARGGASVGDDGYNEREGSVGVRYQF